MPADNPTLFCGRWLRLFISRSVKGRHTVCTPHHRWYYDAPSNGLVLINHTANGLNADNVRSR